MADERGPRPSTDREDAPLLRDPDAEQNGHGEHRPPKKSFSDHINGMVQEPLTPLAKLLLVLALILLLLTSIFIGLFAGAEHKLKTERGKHSPLITATTTATTTQGGGTSTLFSTSTVVTTSTVPIGPVPTGRPGSNLCTTSECVVISANILESLDETQDPCEDFYQFANGGWLSTNEIPPGKGSFGAFEKLSEENKRIIRKFLDPPTETSSASASEAPDYDDLILRKLRNLYTSCMNEDLLNERGLEPLLDTVNVVRSLYRTGDWKAGVLKDQGAYEVSRMKHGLTAAISYMHSRGIDGLFGFDIDGDVGVDPNLMTLWFFQPDLGLPSKEYYEEKSIRELYKETLAKMLLALDDSDEDEKLDDILSEDTDEKEKVWPPWPWPPWGDDEDDGKDRDHKPSKPANKTERAYNLARKVIKFEKRIANASLDLEDLYDPIGTYNPTPFTDFASQLPQISFPMYFSTFTPRSFPTRVILTSPSYASSLSAILSSTSSDVVEAYLVTRVALALAPLLGHDTAVWQANRALEETLQGIKKGQVPDRADWCVQRVETTMGFAAGRYFVEETFGGDSREKSEKVITDIISAFKDSLKHLKWMDEESASAAAEKADAIRVKVGYPLSPDTMSAAAILRYYSLVIINKDCFMENVVSARISDVYKKWQKLGKQRDPEEWEMYPSMVNAYFNPPANEIVFPAGILRPPFFSQSWPAYLQYGAFGEVAAHELTHAFDSSGRLYNQQGKLEQWWTNATSKGFKKIQDCIADQYSNYTIDDGKGGKVHVNGNLTSGENIGDSGLIQAFRAWRGQFHTSMELGREYLLPGLNYTQEQLFFIAFGQVWAQTIKPAAAVQRVRTDPHSPNKYRVEGTLSNVPEFAAAFKCKAGAKLNPPKDKQCKLWES